MTREELFELHHKLCTEALTVMERKNRDYGADDDPFRNFRQFGPLGILVRLSDKLSRMQTYVERGHFVSDETFEETARDAINYVILLVGILHDTGRMAGITTSDNEKPPVQTHRHTLNVLGKCTVCGLPFDRLGTLVE
jgi:hypothetical protein